MPYGSCVNTSGARSGVENVLPCVSPSDVSMDSRSTGACARVLDILGLGSKSANRVLFLASSGSYSSSNQSRLARPKVGQPCFLFRTIIRLRNGRPQSERRTNVLHAYSNASGRNSSAIIDRINWIGRIETSETVRRWINETWTTYRIRFDCCGGGYESGRIDFVVLPWTSRRWNVHHGIAESFLRHPEKFGIDLRLIALRGRYVDHANHSRLFAVVYHTGTNRAGTAVHPNERKGKLNTIVLR